MICFAVHLFYLIFQTSGLRERESNLIYNYLMKMLLKKIKSLILSICFISEVFNNKNI